jgi:signal transduction histidine kinase
VDEIVAGLRATDAHEETDAAVLPGLVRWALAVAGGSDPGAGVVVVAGPGPLPDGAVAGRADGPLLAVAAPGRALVAAAEGERAVWSDDPSAVLVVLRAVAPEAAERAGELLDGGPAARATGEHGEHARAAGPDPAALIAALAAAVGAAGQRAAARLHDGPVQQLTAAHLLLDSALLGAELPAGTAETVEQGVTALREAIAACRALMAELTPDRAAG